MTFQERCLQQEIASYFVRNMNDPAVYLQKDKILCAIAMFRNLTRSELFSIHQIVVACLQGVQLRKWPKHEIE